MAKEFNWRGLSKEELMSMDLNKFMTLICSRQRRSLKRGLTSAQESFMKEIRAGKNNVKTHCRNLIITPELLDKTVHVHNGKTFVQFTVVPEMLGHYLGEFSLTRKFVGHSSAGVGATRSSKAVSAR